MGEPVAYVLGAAKTRFGPTSRTLQQLAQEAIIGALRDSGYTPDDIQAVVVSNFLGGPNESQLHLNSVVAGVMPGRNIPSWRVEAACASGGVALHQAVLALHTYDPILVVGLERLTEVVGMALTRNIAMAGDVFLDQSVGLTFPASYALVAQAHMQRYGTTTRDLELVSLKNHANALLNPKAHFYHKNVGQSDIDAGASVATPLRLFDCCPVSDGAAAMIISRKPGGDSRSVAILGSSVSSDVISLVQRSVQTSFPAAVEAAKRAYAQARITALDIDLAEVHDCFTIAEIVAMEDLGLAVEGGASELLRAGETRIGGSIPINPSGGLKAGGHAIGATGVGQAVEIVQQLRGEAGARQVEGATVGVSHNVGGVGGTCAVHVFGETR